MYVAVKGGEKAIANAPALLAKEGHGDDAAARVSPEQIASQMPVLVARVMNEGSLYDRQLAARAIIQAQGDVLEAITLVRSYRTTLPRYGYTEPVDTAELPPQRRISATFKDIPGGQQLGATFDYTHRLFAENSFGGPTIEEDNDVEHDELMPRVSDLLGTESLIEPERPDGFVDTDPADITREPMLFPISRAERLQALARGDEGFVLSLGYSTQRGFGRTHPFAGEVRVGEVEVEYVAPELGFAVPLGRIEVTECQMINQFTGNSYTQLLVSSVLQG
jgi:alpha-D-ribose 1-methylphosphonate 5-triphosphate synthase subunit PhnI